MPFFSAASAAAVTLLLTGIRVFVKQVQRRGQCGMQEHQKHVGTCVYNRCTRVCSGVSGWIMIDRVERSLEMCGRCKDRRLGKQVAMRDVEFPFRSSGVDDVERI